MRQQCPEVEMWDKPPTEEDAPVGNSLRCSSQKTSHEATNSIRLQVDDGGRNKSSRRHGVCKRSAVNFPQLLEPSSSDLPYVPVAEPKSFRIDDTVTCLESGEEIAPTTAGDTACLQEIDRTPCTHEKVNKMCKKFSRLMAMGSGATGKSPKRNPKCQKAGIKENYSWMHPCFIIIEDKVTCQMTGKQIVVAIWAICRLCKFKLPDCKVYGVKTKPANCPS